MKKRSKADIEARRRSDQIFDVWDHTGKLIIKDGKVTKEGEK